VKAADRIVKPSRGPRADAIRNRERVLEAAKLAFASVGADVSLEEIARRAGVGIGTLYRNFPTRDAIVEAVYRREVQHMADTATRLMGERTPGDALHEWLKLSVAFVSTKKGMASALGSIANADTELYAYSAELLTQTVNRLVRHAADSGDIRSDVEPADILRALTGFVYGSEHPGWEASTLRLIDILMDGLRKPRSR